MNTVVKRRIPARDYLDAIGDCIREIMGSAAIGLYLHGSAVQQDFQPHVSDIDILGVVSRRLTKSERSALTSALSHETRPVPAVGLEIILCPLQAVQSPSLDLPFEFALSTGANWSTVSETEGIASDIVINITLCRQAGRALLGPPPDRILEPVAHDLLCRALIEELRWHTQNLLDQQTKSQTVNAVLNAARSVYAAKTGTIVSKSEGGVRWLRHSPTDNLVTEALAKRAEPDANHLDITLVQAFLKRAIETIEGYLVKSR